MIRLSLKRDPLQTHLEVHIAKELKMQEEKAVLSQCQESDFKLLLHNKGNKNKQNHINT